jgi:glucosyl-3-phosphoglycerate synthase
MADPVRRVRRAEFPSFRRVVVPILHGSDSPAALGLAWSLAPEVVLLGMVRVAPDEVLSAAAARASDVRRTLRQIVTEADGRARARARVRVSEAPWPDLQRVLVTENPDLLVLEWPTHFQAMGLEVDEILATSPCATAIVHGPLPSPMRRVLVPVRGGPYAELALRIGLRLQPSQLTVLHLTSADPRRPAEQRDAPFLGLQRVLRRLPEVDLESRATSDPAQTILDAVSGYDAVVLGTGARADDHRPALGAVASRLLQESPIAVIAVRTPRPPPASPSDETAGVEAISILVDKWFAENTYQADEFSDLELLLKLKKQQGLTISLALPALNEEETVARVIRTLRRALLQRAPLLDEIVLIDSDSTDRTREIAEHLGIPVHIHQKILPQLGPRLGKGEALWKSLLVTQGDLVVWIDTDIVNIHPRFVYGVIGPLLLDRRVQLVKGFYRRPLRAGDRIQAGGGRVTELTARPLLNLFYPELSGLIQPLSGEYGGRRSALEQLPFFSGYGVETGLLIDIFERFGLAAVAQVDLLERIHHNQPLEALSKMSFAIIQAVVGRLERRYGPAILDDVNKSMKLIRSGDGGYWLDVEELVERERPPMITVPEYRSSRKKLPPL